MKRRQKKSCQFSSPLCRILFLAPWFSSSNRERSSHKNRVTSSRLIFRRHIDHHTAPALLERALAESEGESKITHRIKFEKRREKKTQFSCCKSFTDTLTPQSKAAAALEKHTKHRVSRANEKDFRFRLMMPSMFATLIRRRQPQQSRDENSSNSEWH